MLFWSMQMTQKLLLSCYITTSYSLEATHSVKSEMFILGSTAIQCLYIGSAAIYRTILFTPPAFFIYFQGAIP